MSNKHLLEGLYMFRPTLSDSAREKALEKVTDFMKELGGSVDKVLPWGRKKLEYDIKGAREGFYILIYFSLPPGKQPMDELIRFNHLHEDLLRFMHTVAEEPWPTEEVTFPEIKVTQR